LLEDARERVDHARSLQAAPAMASPQ